LVAVGSDAPYILPSPSPRSVIERARPSLMGRIYWLGQSESGFKSDQVDLWLNDRSKLSRNPSGCMKSLVAFLPSILMLFFGFDFLLFTIPQSVKICANAQGSFVACPQPLNVLQEVGLVLIAFGLTSALLAFLILRRPGRREDRFEIRI
jgi:hypothetical protein